MNEGRKRPAGSRPAAFLIFKAPSSQMGAVGQALGDPLMVSPFQGRRAPVVFLFVFNGVFQFCFVVFQFSFDRRSRSGGSRRRPGSAVLPGLCITPLFDLRRGWAQVSQPSSGNRAPTRRTQAERTIVVSLGPGLGRGPGAIREVRHTIGTRHGADPCGDPGAGMIRRRRPVRMGDGKI